MQFQGRLGLGGLLAVALVGCGDGGVQDSVAPLAGGEMLDTGAAGSGGFVAPAPQARSGENVGTSARPTGGSGGKAARTGTGVETPSGSGRAPAPSGEAGATGGGSEDPYGGTGGEETPGGSPPEGMRMGTNFWNLAWGRTWADAFKPDATFASGSDPWNPAFLEEIRPYAAFRFMDWGDSVGDSDRTWAERTPPNAPASQQIPLAYEWMIDLSNRLDRDMWITLPAKADADYSYQLAQLVDARLEPELRVYVEFSNETWNAAFQQGQYAYERGNALGLDPDPWTAAFKFQVYGAVRVFEQFERVFGKSNPRMVKVLAGQATNEWMTQLHLDALADRKINPNGITPDAYTIAPYFGSEISDPNGIEALRATMRASVAIVESQARIVRAAGLSFIAYEGGQHVYQGGADAINARPEMYQIYMDYFDGVAPHMDLFMHYVHNSSWNNTGAWGAEQYVGQPLSEAHKLRAIYDWIEENH